MPEPNLPPLKLSLDENDMKSNLINVPLLKKQIPELPSSFRNNLITKYKLSIDTVLRLLVSNNMYLKVLYFYYGIFIITKYFI